MSHTKIEMDVMQMQLRTMTKLLELQEIQADALDRIAKQCEDLMAFLHGTTIQQVETKRKEMRKKNKGVQMVDNRVKPTDKRAPEGVQELKDFVEKSLNS